MGLFGFFSAEKKEEKLMKEKTSRAVAIVVSYTAPEELGDDVGANFGKAVFKLKKDEVWEEFEVILREKVGELVAKRALEKGIEEVVFDRGGYIFHGRVKELADAAREAGLKF